MSGTRLCTDSDKIVLRRKRRLVPTKSDRKRKTIFSACRWKTCSYMSILATGQGDGSGEGHTHG